ncbi:MAG TPA: ABC transporter permease [Bryobacteraceae bacterium]|jgi:predicted permease|nr:ABC transporter permease [Bryobacteraceae bacterium]
MLALWNRFTARIASLFRSRDLDGDFDQEMQSHLAMLAEENVRRGMAPGEALRQARLRLGSRTQLAELHREQRGLPILETLLQDLRYAARTMHRDIGLTCFVILILGLGIGAATTVFSLTDAVLLRPLPFHDPSRLVWIANKDVDGEGLSGETVPVNHYKALLSQNRSFADIAAFSPFYRTGDDKLTGNGDPQRLTGLQVSQNFFPVLGVRPIFGRDFTADDCQFRWNSPKVALLSYSLWQTLFHSDRAIVGRGLVLNDTSVTVIGVLPQTFSFDSVFAPGNRIDLYLPYPLTDQASQRGNELAMFGRLKPGATLESARAEIAVLGPRIRRMDPDRNFQLLLDPLSEHVAGHLRTALFVLMCAVGVVMLIACANLANLLLARSASRRKEVSIRAALGAGRIRLARQMLTESVLLSCCGAAAGLALSWAGTRALAHLQAFRIPMLDGIRVDSVAVGFTLLLAIATGLVFGLIPALQIPGALGGGWKESTRGSSQSRRQLWIRNGLVVSEIAFACVLLVGAGLLIRSFLRILDVNLGFQPKMAASLRVDPSARYSTQGLRNAYFDETLRRVRGIHGIEAAGLTDGLPLGISRTWNLGRKDRVYTISDPPPPVFIRVVSDGYLRAMGIPLRAGRDLSAGDTATSPLVAVINESFARTLWPGQSPIGQMLGADRDRQVVGVASDVRHLALEQGSGNEIYLPIRQTRDYSSVDLVIRATVPLSSLATPVRRTLRELDPTIPANQFHDLQGLVDNAVSPRRFVVMLLAGFSAFALLLASLGIYAVVSYSVSQRKQEIGIRMALGARAGDVQAGIVRQTLMLAAIGIALGMAGSWALSRTLKSLLFGVTSTDPLTFAAMLVILTAVALAAGYLPARRASRIDPASILRAE